MKKNLLAVGLGVAVVMFSYSTFSVAEDGASQALQAHELQAKAVQSHNMMGHSMAMTPIESFIKAEKPTYPIGSKVTVKTDHMEGMLGATAVVSGVFDTTVYAIDYISTDTNEKVTNHKWIVQEEIDDSKGKIYAVGDTVKLTGGHMSSMGGEGQTATISEIAKGPAYMLDVYPTDSSPVMKNHQWVIESEIEPAQ